jgi:hypothetical protein
VASVRQGAGSSRRAGDVLGDHRQLEGDHRGELEVERLRGCRRRQLREHQVRQLLAAGRLGSPGRDSPPVVGRPHVAGEHRAARSGRAGDASAAAANREHDLGDHRAREQFGEVIAAVAGRSRTSRIERHELDAVATAPAATAAAAIGEPLHRAGQAEP